MKKILTASLVAMMAVTAANANIASTEYITDKVLGGELSTLSTTEKKVVPAINELKTAVTDAGSAASGALAAAKSELEGKITTEAGAREAADTELDGKITALDTETTNALALKEDKANKVTDTYDENSEVQYPSMKLVTTLISESEEGSAADLNAIQSELTGLITAEENARKAADSTLQGAIDAINNDSTGVLATAKKYADDQDAAQTATLQGEIATAKSGAESTAKAYTDTEIAKIDTAYKAADATLQGAIDAINNAESGILAEAKEYADTKDAAQTNTITTAYTSAIATAKSGAETTAKNYTDAEIAKINSADTGILKQAKDYTDAEVKELADGTVASNTAAINAINNETTGILAKANKHSDDADAAQTTALQQYADTAEADAIAAAKAAGDSAYAAKSYEARVEGNETDISGIKTNLGPLDVKIPAACAAGETCSLVMKKGQVAWEVISY